MDFPLLVRDPDKKVRSLVTKITHSGEVDLDKQYLNELKDICKSSKDQILIITFKQCMRCLRKEHSQVRVSTLKLVDYLFRKSHIFREKLLDEFDTFIELTLAITQRSGVKLKLPPPKKHATLLQELAAKTINSWHSDFGAGYERIRYVYKFLGEHRLVDFSQFRVRNQEELIKQQEMAAKEEKILTRSIDNRLKEFRELKPETEQILAQIESLLDLLTSNLKDYLPIEKPLSPKMSDTAQRQHGIISISKSIEIEFSPYLEIERNQDNIETIQSLRELKKQLVEHKMIKLVNIEKTISKRSSQFLSTLKEIIELKNKSMNIVFKLNELKIISDPIASTSKDSTILDDVDSDSNDSSSFEEVKEKEGLETYIPKSMRFEYGLESIDPKELSSYSRVELTDECFSLDSATQISSSGSSLVMPCNVLLESGKLCPRRDKVKCPFHGKIIARDNKGVPLDDEVRLEEERKSRSKPTVPDWQDPELLRDIKEATGVDLTMPKKGAPNSSKVKNKLANVKTCDLTPKKRLQRKLKLLKK